MTLWPHQPVLLEEVLKVFSFPIRYFFDGTLGAGGHAEALLRAHPEIEGYVGVDQDPAALAIAQKRLDPWQNKVKFQRGDFVDLEQHLAQLGIPFVDGILLDLGVSSMQFDTSERGFSFSQEGPLDMRMDPAQHLTAREIVNQWEEEKLGRLFRDYGEEKRWRAAARVVVEERKKKPITTTQELVKVVEQVLGRGKKGKIHPATLIFQALRLAVNQELEKVEKIVPQAVQHLARGGRVAVISFHSLEDRIVKRQFRYLASDKEETSGFGGVFISKEPLIREIVRKPITPNPEELAENPRCRSAKLRVAERR